MTAKYDNIINLPPLVVSILIGCQCFDSQAAHYATPLFALSEKATSVYTYLYKIRHLWCWYMLWQLHRVR